MYVIRVYFSTNFPSLDKVTMVFAPKLSSRCFLFYQSIHTEVTRSTFVNNISPLVNVTAMFVRKLSCTRFISCYFHVKLLGLFFNNSPPCLILSRCLYLSYHVYGMYITIVFTKKVTGVMFFNNFFAGLKVTMMFVCKL